jgi:hypothetical protein
MSRELKHLEANLLRLNQEKDVLTAEYDRMPAHSGRTLSIRARKQELEDRLAALDREISSVRLRLKISGYR